MFNKTRNLTFTGSSLAHSHSSSLAHSHWQLSGSLSQAVLWLTLTGSSLAHSHRQPSGSLTQTALQFTLRDSSHLLRIFSEFTLIIIFRYHSLPDDCKFFLYHYNIRSRLLLLVSCLISLDIRYPPLISFHFFLWISGIHH